MKKSGKKSAGDLTGVGAQAYDTAADFGRFMSLVGLFVGGFLGLLFIGLGIYLLNNNVPMTKTVNTTDENGKVVTTTQPGNSKTPGYILLGFGIFILIIACLQYYIIRRFKIAAAASGVGNAFGFGDAAFNMVT